jgi:hypothetical protein
MIEIVTAIRHFNDETEELSKEQIGESGISAIAQISDETGQYENFIEIYSD